MLIPTCALRKDESANAVEADLAIRFSIEQEENKIEIQARQDRNKLCSLPERIILLLHCMVSSKLQMTLTPFLCTQPSFRDLIAAGQQIILIAAGNEFPV